MLAAGLWDGAYYAVEFGLKACILARVERTGIIFEDKKFAADCWTHDTEKLLGLADLKTDRDRDRGTPAGSVREFAWKTVAAWSEESRYERYSRADAESLVKATTDPIDGVLPWTKVRC